MSKWHLTKDGYDQKIHSEGEIQPPNSRMDGCQRTEIIRKRRKDCLARLQRAPTGGKRSYSLQPTGRYSAINSKRLAATNQDTFVSAQESSKLRFTKCLFFAVRNTSPCQTDSGTSGVTLPAKIAGGLMRVGEGVRGASWESRAAGTTSVGRRWEWQGRIQREHGGRPVRCGGTVTQVTLGKH